jgi:diacylglycerol O-acyltransferase / wax synthase
VPARSAGAELIVRNCDWVWKKAVVMPNLSGNKSFSFGDALFLYIEREGQPLNIASVSIFEGRIKRSDIIKHVASKLPLIPRYRQRVVFPPLDLGLPTWEFDPQFSIRNHIREVKLRHGTEKELKALAAKIVSARLDRRRPLWDFTLARLQDGRTGVVIRIHHCLADGIAGVGMMNVVMDTSSNPPPLSRQKPQLEPPPPPRDAGAMFLNRLIKTYSALVSGALSLHSELLNMAQEAVADPTGPVSDMVNVMAELAIPAERLPFNQICRGPQKFAWTEIPLADIKAVKNNCGGTVNDVVLTTVTLAFGHYAEKRGVDLKGRSLRIVVPVNVRCDGAAHELGNQISFVPVPVPLDIRDPQKLLAVVRQRVEFLKRARAAEFVGLFGGLLSTLPTAFWANVGPVASQLPLSLCNIICTNVPGPQVPLYLMGHKMLSWYPWVPIGGLMGINCAILTYNGTAYFGFTGDVHAAPDLELLEGFVDVSFAELKNGAVSPGPPPRKRERPNAKIPLGKKASPPRHKPEGSNGKLPIARRVARTRPQKNAMPTMPAPTAEPVPEPQPEKSLTVAS